MSEDKIIRNFFLFLSFWFLGSFVTYGHAYKINKQECIEQKQTYCIAGIDSTLESIVWPYHWSKTLWK